MIGIFDPSGNWLCKYGNEKEKDQGRNHQGDHAGAENIVLILFGFVEPEKCRFHSIGQHDHQKGGIGIKDIYRSVIARKENPGIQGNKQIAKNSSENT